MMNEEMNARELALIMEVARLNKEQQEIKASYEKALMTWRKQLHDDELYVPKITVNTNMMIGLGASQVMLTIVPLMSIHVQWNTKIVMLVLLIVLWIRQDGLLSKMKHVVKRGV